VSILPARAPYNAPFRDPEFPGASEKIDMNRLVRHWNWPVLLGCVFLVGGLALSRARADDGAYTAVTAQNPEISLAELGLRLDPLTRPELAGAGG
jgi:hypothetical protein